MAATHPRAPQRLQSPLDLLAAAVCDGARSDFLGTRRGAGPRCARLPSPITGPKAGGCPAHAREPAGPRRLLATRHRPRLRERGGRNGAASHRHHLQFPQRRPGTWQFGSHLLGTDALPPPPLPTAIPPTRAPLAQLPRLSNANAGPLRLLVCSSHLSLPS